MNTMQEITLTNNNWKLVLDLNGGKIKEVCFKGQQILGTFQRIDGKLSNTHLCVPNFAAEGEDLGLPFHGPTRTSMWSLKDQAETAVTICCEVSSTEKYPASLLIEQKFTLNNKFEHDIFIANSGPVAVPVNLGVHYYWATPSGWRGTSVNGKDVTAEIEKNGNILLNRDNTIIFPHQPKLDLFADGFNNAVLWTAFVKKEKSIEYDTRFCCIEPVRNLNDLFRAPNNILGAQKSKNFLIQISLN